jgi:DNA-binding CsgD family transcriptional regulator
MRTAYQNKVPPFTVKSATGLIAAEPIHDVDIYDGNFAVHGNANYSTKELNSLVLGSLGLGQQAIGRELSHSKHTIQGYQRSTYAKLGTGSTMPQAVHGAFSNKLLQVTRHISEDRFSLGELELELVRDAALGLTAYQTSLRVGLTQAGLQTRRYHLYEKIFADAETATLELHGAGSLTVAVLLGHMTGQLAGLDAEATPAAPEQL